MIGMGLYVVALVGKSDELKRASLVLFLGIAVLSIAVYISGNGAAEAICDGSDTVAHLDGQDAAPPDKPCRL